MGFSFPPDKRMGRPDKPMGHPDKPMGHPDKPMGWTAMLMGHQPGKVFSSSGQVRTGQTMSAPVKKGQEKSKFVRRSFKKRQVKVI